MPLMMQDPAAGDAGRRGGCRAVQCDGGRRPAAVPPRIEWGVTRAPARTILIAGATGLVGRGILELALADPSIAAVHALARRALPQQHPRLTPHIVDYRAMPELPAVDEVYLALGTTIRVAGSQEAFRAVDFDANLAVAQAARRAGARRVGLVSAMGADAGSRVFYSRVKGELEEALGTLELAALVMARPSLLVGDRESLGQPPRAGERVGMVVGRVLGRLIPPDYRPIAATAVARALLTRVPLASGREVLRSGVLQEYST